MDQETYERLEEKIDLYKMTKQELIKVNKILDTLDKTTRTSITICEETLNYRTQGQLGCDIFKLLKKHQERLENLLKEL